MKLMQKRKSVQKIEHPNFNSLKPYTIFSTEYLSDTVLSITGGVDDGTGLNQDKIDTKQTLQESMAKL